MILSKHRGNSIFISLINVKYLKSTILVMLSRLIYRKASVYLALLITVLNSLESLVALAAVLSMVLNTHIIFHLLWVSGCKCLGMSLLITHHQTQPGINPITL